ncbi:hypothetical protein [Robertmurraya siralis]|uniref:hypothetical protein n=1 Tax=Robertmurraya siralis TaxID=77777 RepID=UPI0010F5588D|nr:hypothetical protein [Robertmurraya siralis]
MKNVKYAKGSWMEKEIKDKLHTYLYHQEQIKKHEEEMKKIVDSIENSIEGYHLEYKEIEEFLKEHSERNQRMRQYGHRFPIVEDILQ